MLSHIDKVAWIHLKDHKVIMTKTKGRDKWYNPGGKPNPGESHQETLIREINEELSVDILPETIEFYGNFEAQAHNQPEGVMVRMNCYLAEYSGVLTPSNEIEQVAYFGYAERVLASFVDQLIFEDLKKKALIQ